MRNTDSLNKELLNAGLIPQTFMNESLSPLATLVNSSISAKPYKAILVNYLDFLKGKDLEMLIRALSEKGINDVSHKLLQIFDYKVNYPGIDLWAVGNAISIIDDPSTYDKVIKICQLKDLGTHRQMMMTTLRNIKTEESFNILLNALEDETVRGHAINELGKWSDIRALESIEKTPVRKGFFEVKAKKEAIEKLKIAAKNT